MCTSRTCSYRCLSSNWRLGTLWRPFQEQTFQLGILWHSKNSSQSRKWEIAIKHQTKARATQHQHQYLSRHRRRTYTNQSRIKNSTRNRSRLSRGNRSHYTASQITMICIPITLSNIKSFHIHTSLTSATRVVTATPLSFFLHTRSRMFYLRPFDTPGLEVLRQLRRTFRIKQVSIDFSILFLKLLVRK